MKPVIAAALLSLAFGCAVGGKAQRPAPEPSPVPPGQSVEELLTQARAAFAQRPDPESVRQSEALFEAAAQRDPRDIEGLYGAIQAKLWRLEHASEAADQDALIQSAVESGKQCLERAVEQAACHFGLALALGVKARANVATALPTVNEMLARLRRAAELDARFEQGGPSRILATVLLRAPGWPIGPGDSELALEEARKAVALVPEYPPNLLVLSEALLANREQDEARGSAQRALEFARAAAASGEPDAPGWVAEAEQLLARAG